MPFLVAIDNISRRQSSADTLINIPLWCFNPFKNRIRRWSPVRKNKQSYTVKQQSWLWAFPPTTNFFVPKRVVQRKVKNSTECQSRQLDDTSLLSAAVTRDSLHCQWRPLPATWDSSRPIWWSVYALLITGQSVIDHHNGSSCNTTPCVRSLLNFISPEDTVQTMAPFHHFICHNQAQRRKYTSTNHDNIWQTFVWCDG